MRLLSHLRMEFPAHRWNDEALIRNLILEYLFDKLPFETQERISFFLTDLSLRVIHLFNPSKDSDLAYQLRVMSRDYACKKEEIDNLELLIRKEDKRNTPTRLQRALKSIKHMMPYSGVGQGDQNRF